VFVHIAGIVINTRKCEAQSEMYQDLLETSDKYLWISIAVAGNLFVQMQKGRLEIDMIVEVTNQGFEDQDWRFDELSFWLQWCRYVRTNTEISWY